MTLYGQINDYHIRLSFILSHVSGARLELRAMIMSCTARLATLFAVVFGLASSHSLHTFPDLLRYDRATTKLDGRKTGSSMLVYCRVFCRIGEYLRNSCTPRDLRGLDHRILGERGCSQHF